MVLADGCVALEVSLQMLVCFRDWVNPVFTFPIIVWRGFLRERLKHTDALKAALCNVTAMCSKQSEQARRDRNTRACWHTAHLCIFIYHVDLAFHVFQRKMGIILPPLRHWPEQIALILQRAWWTFTQPQRVSNVFLSPFWFTFTEGNILCPSSASLVLLCIYQARKMTYCFIIKLESL